MQQHFIAILVCICAMSGLTITGSINICSEILECYCYIQNVTTSEDIVNAEINVKFCILEILCDSGGTLPKQYLQNQYHYTCDE